MLLIKHQKYILLYFLSCKKESIVNIVLKLNKAFFNVLNLTCLIIWFIRNKIDWVISDIHNVIDVHKHIQEDLIFIMNAVDFLQLNSSFFLFHCKNFWLCQNQQSGVGLNKLCLRYGSVKSGVGGWLNFIVEDFNDF